MWEILGLITISTRAFCSRDFTISFPMIIILCEIILKMLGIFSSRIFPLMALAVLMTLPSEIMTSWPVRMSAAVAANGIFKSLIRESPKIWAYKLFYLLAINQS